MIIRESIEFKKTGDPKFSLEVGMQNRSIIKSMIEKILDIFKKMQWKARIISDNEQEIELLLQRIVDYNMRIKEFTIGYRFIPQEDEFIKHYPLKQYGDPNIPVEVGWYSYYNGYMTANGKTPKEALERINEIAYLKSENIKEKIDKKQKEIKGLKKYNKFMNEIS